MGSASKAVTRNCLRLRSSSCTVRASARRDGRNSKPDGEFIEANAPGRLAARAPNTPDLSGAASADFQIADDIRVWVYDKSDYSIRLDAMTGQLEQILLDIFFEVEAPMLSGGRVAGGRVAGGRVAGGRVAGGRVAGGRVAGGRARGGGRDSGD